jgi:hypothetical protein
LAQGKRGGLFVSVLIRVELVEVCMANGGKDFAHEFWWQTKLWDWLLWGFLSRNWWRMLRCEAAKIIFKVFDISALLGGVGLHDHC